jgi:hypothetical protein
VDRRPVSRPAADRHSDLTLPQALPHGRFSPSRAIPRTQETRFTSGFQQTRPTGFEPVTFGFVDRRSIQLSYGRGFEAGWPLLGDSMRCGLRLLPRRGERARGLSGLDSACRAPLSRKVQRRARRPMPAQTSPSPQSAVRADCARRRPRGSHGTPRKTPTAGAACSSASHHIQPASQGWRSLPCRCARRSPRWLSSALRRDCGY